MIEKSWSKSRLILKKCYRDQEKLSRSSKVLAKSLKVRSWSKNYLEHKKYTKIIKKLNLDLWKVRRVILKNLKLYLKTWPRLTLAKMLSRSKIAFYQKSQTLAFPHSTLYISPRSRIRLFAQFTKKSPKPQLF